tara:strand:- start:10 stop:822 length:813 start_codon:yes stop_codon:yes gene_type:complete
MNPNDLAVALGNSQVQETAAGGASFLKIDADNGDWLLGSHQEIVTGEKILVNTSTIQHGWILWSNNRPTKIMTAFNQPLPISMASIGEDHPKKGRSFQGAMMDDGESLSFDTSSYGGLKGFDVLLAAIKLHAATRSKFLYPMVELTSERYQSPKKKKDANGEQWVYNPIFKIVAWCDEDANVEPTEAAQVTDQSEPASKTRRKRRTKAEMAADAAANEPDASAPYTPEEIAQGVPDTENTSNPLPDDNEPPPADEPMPPRRQRRQRSSAA